MKKFNVKENIAVVTSESFKNSIRSAVNTTSGEHNSYGRTMYDKSFIATILTYNPINQQVEYFLVFDHVNLSDTLRVNALIQNDISAINNTEIYSKNELITVVKAAEFEYFGITGYPSNDVQENRRLKLENKFMSIYIEIFGRMNESENDRPIDELNLSVRSYNCLKRAGYKTVDQVRNASLLEMTKVRNLGRNSLEEIEQVLNIKFA